jgi:hypothetical protein
MIQTKQINPLVDIERPINVVLKGLTLEDGTGGYYVEQEIPYKVYHSTAYVAKKKLITNATSLHFLNWIEESIPKDSDTIRIERDEVMALLGISRGTYFKALNTALDIRLIYKKKTNVYYINPYYVFRGNRVTYFKRYGVEFLNVVSAHKNGIESSNQMQID